MLRVFVFGTILILGSTATSLAQPTALSFQGFVKDGANAANGNYDFEFALFDSLSGGNQIGSTISRGGVVVSNGSFAVTLDFGGQFPGSERFLEIRMRVSGGGPFITLSPRQAVTSSPYSIRSLSADNAANATNAVNATNATNAVIAENAVNATNAANATTAANALQLGGIAASQFVLTADPRLSDSRDPLPGSNNYIQNTTTPNTSNFNIVGSGTVSNTLTAGNAVNAGTEYRIGGSRVIGVTGNLNLFLGVDAGAVNTGTSNTFVGRSAGTSNTSANGNSFFGALAGRDTSTGVNNAFFGASAGLQNTSGQANAFFGNNSGGSNTTGIGNTFLGRLGGAVNTTGNFNTTVGFATDFLSPDLSNATAIGARAAVGQSNSLVLGSINGVNGSTVDTNVGIGTTTPSQKLHVVGNGLITGDLSVSGAFSATLPAGSASYIQNTTTPQATSNFNISGDGTAAGTLKASIVNSLSHYNIGGIRVLSNAGTNNLFVGVAAGAADPQGSNNAFFGAGAGQVNAANSNAFFGSLSGSSNTLGHANSFFGTSSGFSNNEGINNSFFGAGAGGGNTSGIYNSFLGHTSGAGNVTGSFNTASGYNARFGSGSLTNATAIGANAKVDSDNSMVLGSILGVNGATADTNVGIGTTMPTARLHVNGNALVDGNLTVTGTLNATIPGGSANYIQNTTTVQATSNFNISGNGTAAGTLSGNIVNAATQYNIGGNRLIVRPGGSNLFVGSSTGQVNTGGSNSFFGERAGQFNTSGFSNSYFGTNAGSNNTEGSSNSFFGDSAGRDNSTGSDNSFFGFQSGIVNNGSRNSFFGRRAGWENTTALDNSFFGTSSGFSNTTGSFNTFLGSSAGFNNTTGAENVFVGKSAGSANTTAGDNTFVGFNSGLVNTTGSDNAMFGHTAGAANTTASFNSFFGASAGFRTTTGGLNVFVGTDAGLNNTIGTNNTLVGVSAGDTNVSGSNNTILGRNADVGVDGLSFATAIGAGAVVGSSNTVVLGRAADSVVASGKLQVNTLGAAGATPLCRNASNEISTCSSSLRYKANIFPFDSGGSFINKLHPISFDWKDGGMKDVGFAAEEIAKLDPRFVIYNDKGEVEGVKYDRLSVAFVNAFKEQQLIIELQQKRNDELRDQLERQKAKIDDLQSEINELKALVCAERPTVSICKENK